MGQLASLRQIVRFQGEQELVQMALLLAKRVVIEEIRSQPDLIESLLKAALKEVESKGKIRILLHPEDHEFLVQSGLDLDPYVKEEQSLLIKSDPDASPGSIHMESDEEVINFHFQKRFEELRTCSASSFRSATPDSMKRIWINSIIPMGPLKVRMWNPLLLPNLWNPLKKSKLLLKIYPGVKLKL